MNLIHKKDRTDDSPWWTKRYPKRGTQAGDDYRRLQRRIADERLYKARTVLGRVQLRLYPFVGGRGKGAPFMLRGQQVSLAVPEVVDAWDFLHDLYTFVRWWRPMRLRTEPQRAATQEWFAQWERLGAVVEPGRWG